jgi:hypothetical protein
MLRTLQLLWDCVANLFKSRKRLEVENLFSPTSAQHCSEASTTPAAGTGCLFRKLDPGVIGPVDDVAKALDRPFQRAILIQSRMRTRLIVIPGIGRKNSPQVCLTEDDHMIQALASQPAIGIRDRPISPGSPWRNGIAERLTARDASDEDVPIGRFYLMIPI